MPAGAAKLRRVAYRGGAVTATVAALVVAVPATETWHAPGAMSPGHEPLGCVDCHVEAPGSVRQQVQQKVRFWLGAAHASAVFGTLPVDTQRCAECHERRADRHPVSRFLEPRFVEARAKAGAHRCAGCHVEHDGTRVSAQPGLCQHCHQSLRLERDPLADSHASLVARAQWTSCLRCHDFHGNHRGTTPLTLNDAPSEAAIEDYFSMGRSPYGQRAVLAR
jgi:hypothetical protein